MAAILASRRAPAFCLALRNGMMMRPSAPPTPPHPYDYAVEYVERDWAVPWLINGSSGIGGFVLSQYLIGESQADSMRAVELTWSFVPESSGARYALWYVISAFGTGMVLRKKNNRTDYSFYSSGNHDTGVTGSLGTFHVQQALPNGSGTWRFVIDGVETESYAQTATTKFNNITLMRGAYASGSQFKMRVKSFKLGNDVDLIPVVKGNAIGFYNRVDGLLFLEEQECLTTGPRV